MISHYRVLNSTRLIANLICIYVFSYLYLSSVLHRYSHRFSLFKFLTIRFDWIRKQSYRESLGYCILTIRGQVPDKPQQSYYSYPLNHSIQNIEKSSYKIQSAMREGGSRTEKPRECWFLRAFLKANMWLILVRTRFCINWCKFDVNRCVFWIFSNEGHPVFYGKTVSLNITSHLPGYGYLPSRGAILPHHYPSSG